LVAPDENYVDDTIKEKDLRTQALKIVNYILTFLGLVAVIAIVYSGFLMVTAMGNDDQFSKGKQGIGYVMIGIIIILLSYAIVNWVISSGGDSSPGNSSSGSGGSSGTSYENNYYTENYYDFINSENPSNTENNKKTLKNIQNLLDDLLKDLGDYSGLDIGDLQVLFNRYLQNPTDENWETFYETYQALLSDISNMDMIHAVITATPESGNAPLKVTLDGLKSTDPSNTTIPDTNYEWSYVDNNGNTQNLNHKSLVTVEFDEPGSYIINLTVTTDNLENGKKTVLDGQASLKITVYSAGTEFNLKINGDEVETFYKVDLTSAKQGITFDVSEAKPPI